MRTVGRVFSIHDSPFTLPTMASPITRIFLVRRGATVLTAEDRFASARRSEWWDAETRA